MADQRVLVIEDHIIHMTFLKEQLIEQMGILEHNITSAFDGLDAIKEIEFNI
jgi:CheY-like chemotaxis protein